MEKKINWIRKAMADFSCQLYETVDRFRDKYDYVEIRHEADGGYAVYVAND